jgi:hypothetical protein
MDNLRFPSLKSFAISRFGFGSGLGICMLLAAWLRFDQVRYQVLEGDEWHAIDQLTYYTIPQTLLTFGSNDFGIPLVLYYWVLSKLDLLTELTMRMPMLCCGLGFVLLLPMMMRRRLDDRILLIVALLLSLSPFLVYWSRMARTYSITLFTTFLAFGLLALALRKSAARSWALPAYAVLCGLTVWTHPLTGPLLITPLIALWIPVIWRVVTRQVQLAGEETLTFKELLLVTIYTGVSMAIAVLPPLLGDPEAFADRSGIDSPTFDTLLGAIHFWFGTNSTVVVSIAGLLAVAGIGRVWRSCVEIRWVLFGQALTVVALFVSQPWWVDRPLAFGRYLLPMLPCLLLAVSAGIVRVADLLGPKSALKESGNGALVMAIVLVGVWWPTAPLHAWLEKPNSYPTHMYFQYDYRDDHNVIKTGLPLMPASTAWSLLAEQPKDSLLIAAAPYQYATWEWPAPLWEQASGQRVIPGFLWGACVPQRSGEVPNDGRVHIRNAVHLADRELVKARGVDWVVYYLSPKEGSYTPRLPQCEAWFREHYGVPDYEDAALLAWRMDRNDGG